VLLPDPVIHLYWAYALARVDEMFQETPFPTGVCGAPRRARVRDPGPEENHVPVLQAASQGEKRERAGEMSHGLACFGPSRGQETEHSGCLPAIEPLVARASDE
jgi:hypothetical protein